MANPSPLIALYVYGVFDSPDQWTWQFFDGWFRKIEDSSFNVIELSTFHVDTDGSLYGSKPLVADGKFDPTGVLYPGLTGAYQSLAAEGKTLVYSIGNAAGSAGDLNSLWGILFGPTGASGPYASLQQNMTVLKNELAISGIDFDFEPGPGPTGSSAQQVVTAFTSFCNDLGFFVTYCPYVGESDWIAAQIDAVNTGGSVAWWNLQCYAGGFGNTPAGWADAIGASAGPMGISDLATFIVPGTANAGNTPQDMEQQFRQFAAGMTGLAGGFVWQFGDIVGPSGGTAYADPDVEVWAMAVRRGLGFTGSVA